MVKVVTAAALLAISLLGAAPKPAAPPPAASPVPSADASVPQPAETAAADVARERLTAMLHTGHADAAWFSATFLAHVSVSQVDVVVARAEASLGDYKMVDGSAGDYIARFARGTNEVLIHLDSDAKINLLMFRPPKPQ